MLNVMPESLLSGLGLKYIGILPIQNTKVIYTKIGITINFVKSGLSLDVK